MFEIISCLVCLVLWIVAQCGIIAVSMDAVRDGGIRYKIITFLFILEAAAFFCGLSLGLINC